MSMRVVLSALVIVVAIVVAAPSAYAAPTGHLSIGICTAPGAGVTLGSTKIDWTPTVPPGSDNGCIVTGVGTSVTYVGGPMLTDATLGVIKDLTVPSGPVVDFMTFATTPNLHFDLSALLPGPVNTACAGTLDPNALGCSPSLGSPYHLQSTFTGTTLTISAQGIARDAAVPPDINSAPWLGLFTTQFAGVTPLAIQQTLLAGGTISSSESGEFNIGVSRSEIVPEPTTLLLIGSGLVASALGMRKRKP